LEFRNPNQHGEAMTHPLRDQYNEQEINAAGLLDMAKEGYNVPFTAINRALWVLGDLASKHAPSPRDETPVIEPKNAVFNVMPLKQHAARKLMCGD